MRFFPPSPPPIVYCLTLMALMEEDGNLAWLYFLNVSLSVHSHTPATTHTLGSHRRVSGAGAFSFLSGSCLFLHLMLGCSSLCLVLCEFQTLASGRQVCAGPAGHFSIWPSLWPCLSISWGGPELQLAGYAAADSKHYVSAITWVSKGIAVTGKVDGKGTSGFLRQIQDENNFI